jgi:hypothetical protein
MVTKGTKDLILRSLSLSKKKRLVGALLQDITRTASEQDLSLLEELFSSVELLQTFLEDRIRKLRLAGRTVPYLPTEGCRTPLSTWVMDDHAPWMDMTVEPIAMPGMISDEEIRYYEYIGTIYEGRGEVIELGPWLGKSTRHILRGLEKNPKFAGRQLHVFDDFVWRTSWMDRHTPEQERLPNRASFRHLFENYVQDVLPRLNVTCARIVDYEGNETLPRIRWDGDPIEMMYIDCGRTAQVNEGWFEVFLPSFVPDVSLLIMQDWRTHRERPRQSYNQTLWFTAAHPELELVHEVKEGATASFLYRGGR